MKQPKRPPPTEGFLGRVERIGNRLPDPVFLFAYLIAALMVVSVIASAAGLHATVDDDVLQGMSDETRKSLGLVDDNRVRAVSLFSADSVQTLWSEMPQTFVEFHPLGFVLLVMLGAGVAQRSGLFTSAMRQALLKAPTSLLTPAVALVAMLGNHAADAAYVVVIPLAGLLYAGAGRHPIAGIAAAFAGVSGGFSANVAPGQLDALLYGITQEAAVLDEGYRANIAGNTYFIQALLVCFLPVIWYVTDKIIEPRLGKYEPEGDAAAEFDVDDAPLTSDQRRGLRWAGLATLGVVGLWLLMTLGPGTPLIDEAADDGASPYKPFFDSLVGGIFALFLLAGCAYGAGAKTIGGHGDVVKMMTAGMQGMAYYIVLAFAAAHFIAMFGWSQLPVIFAFHGADAIHRAGLPLPLLLVLVVLFSGILNLVIGSASAKWAVLAPVLVPLLMLVGVSPDGATAVYRVGDSTTNVITPLMVWFPIVLVYAQGWKKDFGLGSLTATMVPYSLLLLLAGLALTAIWAFLGLPLGPGAPITYELAGGATG